MFLYHFQTMKQKLWIALITCLVYCVDKEFYKAIGYLKTQVDVLIEQQNKRMRITTKAKRLSRKMLEQYTVLFTPDTRERIKC